MKKYHIAIIFILLFSLDCFCFTNSNSEIKSTILRNGVGLGSVIAVVLSWDRNRSVLFATLHGVFGWFYVVFYLFTRES